MFARSAIAGNASLAQSEERRFCKPMVAGSIPARGFLLRRGDMTRLLPVARRRQESASLVKAQQRLKPTVTQPGQDRPADFSARTVVWQCVWFGTRRRRPQAQALPPQLMIKFLKPLFLLIRKVRSVVPTIILVDENTKFQNPPKCAMPSVGTWTNNFSRPWKDRIEVFNSIRNHRGFISGKCVGHGACRITENGALEYDRAWFEVEYEDKSCADSAFEIAK